MHLMKFGLLAVALAVPFSVIAGDGYVSVETDRFTKATKMAYATPGNDLNKLYFMAHAIHQANESTARLSFMSGGRRWAYLDCHDLNWLVDGIPLTLPNAYHKGSVGGGGVTETVSQKVTSDQLVQIGAAQTVEYRLCSAEGRLTPAEIQAAGEIGAKLKSLLNSAAP